jgi:formylglycine-generating enzyme required for sulfatase activity
MKKNDLGILLILFLLCTAAPAQVNFTPPKATVKAPKQFEFVTPDKIMGVYEVSYSDWVDFLRYQQSNDPDPLSMDAFLPDSSQRNIDLFYNLIYKKEFQPEKLVTVVTREYDYPVTGITKKQAEAYCDYLNDKEKWKDKKIGSKNMRYRFEYRLPTPGEFVKACEDALTTEDLRSVSRTGRNAKGCFLINFNTVPMCKSDSDGFRQMSHRLLPRWAFFPSNLGIYNLQGNVAEMTSEDGKAQGGSYIHTMDDCQLSSIDPYTKPEMWLGFRVVADLVFEEKKDEPK